MGGSNHSNHILCLGINHTTSDVSLRERLAYNSHALNATLSRLGCGEDPCWENLNELVILSTCNRVELYTVSNNPSFDSLEAFLSETTGCPHAEFSDSLYRLMDEEAVRHLFNVAAGLDSMVVGEPQILGQVTDAYAASRKHGTMGKVLAQLFLSAIRAGKRARTETKINHNSVSIASMAVNLISKTIPDLPAAKVMIIGAGNMAELAVESLRKRGVESIIVVNRTLANAHELARRWGGQPASLETLPEKLAQVDIVISSTGAPHTIISADLVEKAMVQRSERPMIIMDIAVPRDVDIEIQNLTNVHLYDIDALSSNLESNLTEREAEIPKVQAIVAQEQAAYEDFLATLDVIPIIVDIRSQADRIRQDELRKRIRQIPDLTPEMENQIDLMTKSIVNKILHSPTVRLRKEASGHNASDYASIARALFGLD